MRTDDDEDKVYPHYEAERPFPKSNTVWGASAYWDTREPKPGWKRVPGCCRIVHESIPDPLPFYAPAWCGWRGVPSSDGKIYDYETGREMRDYRAIGQRGDLVAYGSLVKAKPKGGKK